METMFFSNGFEQYLVSKDIFGHAHVSKYYERRIGCDVKQLEVYNKEGNLIFSINTIKDDIDWQAQLKEATTTKNSNS